jgi:hypothetical protein
MSIVDSQISDISQHGDGFRARFRYELSDGRVVEIGLINVSSELEAGQKLVEKEQEVLASIQLSDAETAVYLDSDIQSSGQASAKQVARQYLKDAMMTEDPYSAHKKLKKADNYIDGRGWTASQIKTNLNMSDDQWSAIVTRYQYLSSNESALDAYELIRQSDPEGEF